MAGADIPFCSQSQRRVVFVSILCTTGVFFLLVMGRMDITVMHRMLTNVFPANASIQVSNVVKFQPDRDREFPHKPKDTCSSSQLLTAIGQGGSWTTREPGKGELEELKSFLLWTNKFYGTPNPPQRPDGKCGNVVMAPNIRANCDPEGPSPCCHNNTCVNKTTDQCRGWDIRKDIHADFGTYQLKDPKCQISHIPSDSKVICPLLKNMTIKFIGDSLIRQTYTSLVAKFKNGDMDAVMKKSTSKDMRHECRGQRLFVAKCRHLLGRDVALCNNTVRLQMVVYYNKSYGNKITDTVRRYLGKPNSIIFIGIGLHDNLNAGAINEHVIQPVGQILANNTWPKVVWVTPNCPGQLKFHKSQLKGNIIQYIKFIRKYLTPHKIPLLDVFKATEGIYSYDGTHLGLGGNNVKVELILNLIRRWKEEWKT